MIKKSSRSSTARTSIKPPPGLRKKLSHKAPILETVIQQSIIKRVWNYADHPDFGIISKHLYSNPSGMVMDRSNPSSEAIEPNMFDPADEFLASEPDLLGDVFVTQTPNQQRLVREGMRSGIPDLTLPLARCGYHALYLEVKSRYGGLSEDQKYWRKILVAAGNGYAVARSTDQGWRLLCAYVAGQFENNVMR